MSLGEVVNGAVYKRAGYLEIVRTRNTEASPLDFPQHHPRYISPSYSDQHPPKGGCLFDDTS
jgi:hypothetical protein